MSSLNVCSEQTDQSSYGRVGDDSAAVARSARSVRVNDRLDCDCRVRRCARVVFPDIAPRAFSGSCTEERALRNPEWIRERGLRELARANLPEVAHMIAPSIAQSLLRSAHLASCPIMLRPPVISRRLDGRGDHPLSLLRPSISRGRHARRVHTGARSPKWRPPQIGQIRRLRYARRTE
jgi:hypothetical protein